MLYPQYCDDEHFPSWRDIIAENKAEFAKRAKEKLAESDEHVADAVREHWERLAQS